MGGSGSGVIHRRGRGALRTSRRIPVLAIAAALAALLVAPGALGATWVVNSANDADDENCNAAHCSLREAINAANQTTGADTIGFAIVASAPSISVTHALPTITGPTTIDGTTQPGYEGNPFVQVNGAAITEPGVDGFLIAPAAAPSTIRGLVIQRFPNAGVHVNGAGSVVEENYIGTDLSGTERLGNGLGVLVDARATVGGTGSDGNLISGNLGHGVQVTGRAADVEVLGNLIGTTVTGGSGLSNGGDGVFLDGASEALIGGSSADARNVISRNDGYGVHVNGSSNLIYGNSIGGDLSGPSELGNGSSGVYVEDGNDNSIGGLESGQGNVISDNGQIRTGVRIAAGVRNRVSSNEIVDNGGLGIDLGEGGVTPNDPGDGDSGANALQNFPELTSAVTNGHDSFVVQGSLDTVPETLARIEFFASSRCDGSAYGEGERYLGFTNVGTAAGTATFSAGFEIPVDVGEAITATTSIGANTSEFSRCIAATDADGPAALVVNTTDTVNDGECDLSHCSLPEAISNANSLAGPNRITFDIDGSGLQTIQATAGLPEITDAVEIDATTQPGYDGEPVVRVDGQFETSNLFVVGPYGGGSSIYGLSIVRAKLAAVTLDSNGNTLRDNEIGSSDLGNGFGVIVNGSNNLIGGDPDPGRGNSISYSDFDGISVRSGTGNDISLNDIWANGGLGIDLLPAGVTPNDGLGDPDSGPNGLQNFPLISSTSLEGSTLDVSGELRSGQSTDYRIELFTNDACDPSGNGEGRRYVGSTETETNSDGVGSFSTTVTLPEGDSVVTATATALPEGSTSEFSACHSIGDTGPGLTLTVDQGSNPAGSDTRSVSLSSIPSNQLQAFSGAPDAAPVGSIPVGSIPVGSIPVGSIPVGSIPVGSIPVGSIPVGSIPVGSIPVGSIGLASIPVGSIGLDQILLTSLPLDWTPILAGTPLAGRVVQGLTLQDVYANATARGRFEALTLAQSGLNRSLLGGVSLAALLLGNKTLSQLPPPEAADWCAAIVAAGGSCAGVNPGATTVTGLSIAGAPVGSIPVGSIPVGSIAGGIAGTPVGSIPVGSIDIGATPLAAILLKDIPNVNTVVDCARISCTTDKTLGDAAALNPSAIRPTATLAALQAVLGDITLNELIIGILPRSALAWEDFPIDGLQLFTVRPASLRYTLDYELDCAKKAGLAITVKLPDGDVVVQGTTTVNYGDGDVDGPNPTTSADTGARWTGLPDPCPGAQTSRHLQLSFTALSSFDLGTGVASASVLAGGETRSVANQAPVLVRQNWETNDDASTAPTVQPDQLIIGHVARTGDQEVFKTPIPTAPGTVTTFYLSHLGDDARAPGTPADFDLVIGAPGTPPLQSNPVGSIPVGSIPIEDKGAGVENSSQPLPPETLQDIPVGSIPVGSISANRGGANEVASVVARGESGFYTVVVRGYNGSYSNEPFVLRVKRTPAPTLPPCQPRGLTLGPQGSLPPGIPSDRKTLFLVNKQRLNAMYGVADTNAMLASLNAILERPEIKGSVLQVDGAGQVRNAYAAWDANPCDVEAANTVVRRINDVVTGYRTTLTDLRYVVMLGSDDALPMARVPDRVSLSPETDFAGELQFTTQNLAAGNALYAAAALGYFLTDGGYGAFTRYQWLGRELLLPQVPVSRLVESSADIKAQLDEYVAANGTLNPQTALTTGYDFLADGAEATGTALGKLVPAGNGHTLIGDTWTRGQLVSAWTGKTPPDDVNAVNAHYNQWQLEPASAASAGDLVSSSDVPAPGLNPAFKDRILFTVGCHGGYNVPNTILSGPVPPQARDWAETWARQKAAVYVANTGFGYGDTYANALSERLMSIFASKLTIAKPIGELWNDAQHEYYGGAGAYDVYDEKALVEASLYGLPFWRIAGATTPAPPPPPPVVTDPVTGLPVAHLSLSPALNENTTPDGRFWDLASRLQVTHFRPLQPRYEQDVTVPGQVAHGIVITSLATNDVAGVDPVLANPTVDLSAHEPEKNFRDVVFPANLVNLTRSRGIRGDRQGFVVNAGQFRPNTPAGPTGIERLVQSIGVEIAYSTSSDVTPPSIRQVGSTFTGSQASILVDVTEPGVKRVAALFNDTLSWRFAELTNLPGTTLWTGTVSSTHTIEVAAMAQDAAGNVGYSTNKGFNFLSVVDSNGPDILIDSPLPGAVYAPGQAVAASFACSDPAGVQSCAGTVPNGANVDTAAVGPHTFTVTATDLGGRQTTKSVQYFVRYAFEGFLDPVRNPPKLNQESAGDIIQPFWKLTDGAGAPITDLATVTSIYWRPIDCDSRPPTEPDMAVTPPDDNLLYVPSKKSFKYMWHTSKTWARTCQRFVVVLADGTNHFADFRFR